MTPVKSLFEPSSAREIGDRIASLRPDSPRQWGLMNPAQMLAHCNAWMEMASGLTTPPRSFVGRVFGRLAKKSLLGPAPARRNLPTDRHLLIQGERDFSAERQRLLDAVARFSAGGPERCTTHPHCFFGPMTADEWALLGYKHLDHHLRQFGA